MEIDIYFNKSAQENAEDFFDKSKKLKKKAEGAEKAITELEASLGNLEKETTIRKKSRIAEKREWYEKFNWFYASDKSLVIGGRSADQNEEIYSKYFEENDLFFHSDIFGASVVILKNGISSPAETKEEAAQFAASFSSAWENGQTTVNVYSLKKGQVTKSRNEGALGKGSFLLKGEREWYKNVALGVGAFIEAREGCPTGKLEVAPEATCRKIGMANTVYLGTGISKKSDVAKAISKKLGYDNIDYIMQHIPSGPFKVI